MIYPLFTKETFRRRSGTFLFNKACPSLYGNFFNVAESNSWFKKNSSLNGGVYGAIIGVSNMETALHFYNNFIQSENS